MTRSELLRAAEVCVCGREKKTTERREDSFRVIGELWETYIKKNASETRRRRFASCRRMWRRCWRC